MDNKAVWVGVYEPAPLLSRGLTNAEVEGDGTEILFTLTDGTQLRMEIRSGGICWSVRV